MDLLKFCQMLLADGVYGGRRYLTGVSIREMTTNQVSERARKEIKDSGEVNGYGLGWFTSASGAFGHEGAYVTSMRIDPKKGLITIWLVQHDGFSGEGAKSFDTFQIAVRKRFGSKSMAAMVSH